MHYPPSALQAHLWEDCIQKAPKWPPFLSFLIWNAYSHWRVSSSSSSYDIDIIWKHRGEGKGSSVRLLEQNSYVSAHGVNNFLPWFDPKPLTLTPTHLTSTGLSTQWSDLVSNQSDPSETEIGWSQLLWKWALLGYKLCLQMTSNSQTSQNDLGIKQFFKLNLITGRGHAGLCVYVCVDCSLAYLNFFILSVDTISVSVN